MRADERLVMLVALHPVLQQLLELAQVLGLGLQLWLLRRPHTAAQVETVDNESDLLERIAHG